MHLDLLWELRRQLRLDPAHPPGLRADKAHSCSSLNFPSCRSTCPFRCFTGTKFRKPSAEV